MQVQVPPGVVGGQIMTVQSGAQLVQVQVPPGLVAGQSFQIKAPEPQVAMMQVQVPAASYTLVAGAYGMGIESLPIAYCGTLRGPQVHLGIPRNSWEYLFL